MDNNFLSFRKDLKRLATTDEGVARLVTQLEESLQDEKIKDEDVVEFSDAEAVAFGILFAFIAYFLFRWSKDYFDHRRAVNETRIAERRIAIIQSMVEGGWPNDVAEAVATRCLEAIAKRTEDDPVLVQVLKTAQKYLPASKEDAQNNGSNSE